MQTLLDFTGGVGSVAQLCMEAIVLREVQKITGDPVKFGLGFVSIIFDIILMSQHYILYRGNKPPESPGMRYVIVPQSQDTGVRMTEAGNEDAPLLSPSALSTSSVQELSTAPSGPSGPDRQQSQTEDTLNRHPPV